MRASATQYSSIQIRSAPTFTPDTSRGKVLVLPLKVTSKTLNAARALSHGRTVIQFDDWKTIAFLDSMGQEFAPRFHHDAYASERILVASGDTVYLRIQIKMRSGSTDYAFRFVDGRKIDSIASPLQRLAGVRSDGSLMYWNVSPRQRKDYSDEQIRSSEAYITILSASSPTATVVANIGVLLETQFRQELPWSRFARAAESGGKVWISPLSGPELIRVGADGLPDLRVRWETADTVITAGELSALKAELIKQIPLSSNTMDRLRRQTAIESLKPTSPIHSIDRIAGGRDGTIAVRIRRKVGEERQQQDSWLSFRSNGELIGTLHFPTDWTVHELTEHEILVERTNPFSLSRIPLRQTLNKQ